MDSLRMEVYDSNISITNICPGPVQSNITQAAFTHMPGVGGGGGGGCGCGCGCGGCGCGGGGGCVDCDVFTPMQANLWAPLKRRLLVNIMLAANECFPSVAADDDIHLIIMIMSLMTILTTTVLIVMITISADKHRMETRRCCILMLKAIRSRLCVRVCVTCGV